MDTASSAERVYLSQMDFIPRDYKLLMGEHFYSSFVIVVPVDLESARDPNVPVYSEDDPRRLDLEMGFSSIERAEEALLETMGYESSRTN